MNLEQRLMALNLELGTSYLGVLAPSLLVKRCVVNIFLQLGGVKCLTYDYICNPNDGIEYGQQQSDHERTEKT